MLYNICTHSNTLFCYWRKRIPSICDTELVYTRLCHDDESVSRADELKECFLSFSRSIVSCKNTIHFAFIISVVHLKAFAVTEVMQNGMFDSCNTWSDKEGTGRGMISDNTWSDKEGIGRGMISDNTWSDKEGIGRCMISDNTWSDKEGIGRGMISGNTRIPEDTWNDWEKSRKSHWE